MGKLGPDAKDAVPHLIRMLQDEDKEFPDTRPKPWAELVLMPRWQLLVLLPH